MKLSDKLKKIIIGSIFFILFFLFNSLVTLFLKKIGIDLSTLPSIPKQIISIIISLILPITMFIVYRKDLISDFKKIKDNYRKYIEVSVLAYTIGIILMAVSNLIIQLGLSQDIAANEQGIRELLGTLPIYMTLSACLIGPFEEEMIFRKIFRDVIDNKTIYIIASGLVFGLLHVVGVSNSLVEMLYFIPYGILGGTFAYMYTKTDNIWIPILVHVIHNTLLVTIQLIAVM